MEVDLVGVAFALFAASIANAQRQELYLGLCHANHIKGTPSVIVIDIHNDSEVKIETFPDAQNPQSEFFYFRSNTLMTKNSPEKNVSAPKKIQTGNVRTQAIRRFLTIPT
jgi:predicted sulfurtransferase